MRTRTRTVFVARTAVERYEAEHWPPVRRAWLNRWSEDRCMACGRARRRRRDPWYRRICQRRLEVHHVRYPRVWLDGDWRLVRGGGEHYTDLIELCVGFGGCHNSGRLRGHTRWWPNLAEITWKHVRARRRRYFWRDPPTPLWAYSR